MTRRLLMFVAATCILVNAVAFGLLNTAAAADQPTFEQLARTLDFKRPITFSAEFKGSSPEGVRAFYGRLVEHGFAASQTERSSVGASKSWSVSGTKTKVFQRAEIETLVRSLQADAPRPEPGALRLSFSQAK